MVGAHQRNRKTAEIRRAAAIHWIEVLQALRNEPHAEIVIRRDRGAGRLGNVEGVVDMIAVAVSEHDMFDPFAGGRFVGNESGIAGEEWIDQDCVAGKVEAKGGVTIPSDLHGGTLRLRMLAAPNNSRAASCGKARSQLRARAGSASVLTTAYAGSFTCRGRRSIAAARRADRS